MVLQCPLQLLHGGRGGVRELGDGVFGAPLPQLALQEVTDVVRVGEELGEGVEGLLAHARRAVLQASATRVRGAPRLLKVAVRKGKRQSALFGIAERVTRRVELRDSLGPT